MLPAYICLPHHDDELPQGPRSAYAFSYDVLLHHCHLLHTVPEKMNDGNINSTPENGQPTDREEW